MTGDPVELALSRIELREASLLSWGIVDAALSREELEGTIRESAGSDVDAAALLAELLERVLIVETPTGGYRSRMAETLRLLLRLRQTFDYQAWWEGSPLIIDYRLLHRPRSRPQRLGDSQDLVRKVAERAGRAAAEYVSRLVPPTVSDFQIRASEAVVERHAGNQDSAVMISAGTGAGKTLAFYAPALGLVADSVAAQNRPSVKMLALYPRGELLKDQLSAVLKWTTQGGPVAGGRPLRVGSWFGATPQTSYWLENGRRSWKEHRLRGQTAGWICPFIRCPACDGELIWRLTDVRTERERLSCVGCEQTVTDEYVTLTRSRAVNSPPDIMFTTTESLNRQLAAPDKFTAFGIGADALRFVLLDEVHTYEGVSGAQNALLLRRLKRRATAPILFAGLSATLEDATEFMARLAGVYPDRVTRVEPKEDELESSGAEYMVALRHDPSSLTSPLSASIQVAMLMGRVLDAPGNPYEPAPTSQGTFGRRAFLFTDKLDVTNRMYWDLLDAEGWWRPDRAKSRPVLTLAHLRAENQGRRHLDRREDPADRDVPGQWWWLPERLGRDLEADEQLQIGRTSSQDAGVDEFADVIVATASLEVGYDDDTVGAVIQHKAPHDAARFLQRKGRAGRDAQMRPWTVVVLSDWGRDRATWQSYENLFDPVLEPRYLPLGNRYVLRMQAVYATLDWLGLQLSGVGTDQSAYTDQSAWTDLSGPASLLHTGRSGSAAQARRERQARLRDLLQEILLGGPAREHLRVHLHKSLAFPADEVGWAEVDALLWSPPRSLMLAVLPTALRRLRSQWEGEMPSPDDQALKTRTPLREFVAGNLFDDLLVPEVEVIIPTGNEPADRESHSISAIRALRELMPGNITRHFGVSTWSRRHWLAPPNEQAGQPLVDVLDEYGAQFQSTLAPSADRPFLVDVYRPHRLELVEPPQELRDASSVRPIWNFDAVPLGSGRRVELGQTGWTALIPEIDVHLHATGDGVRVQRFCYEAVGFSIAPGRRTPLRFGFRAGENSQGRCVGLGVEIEADGIRLAVSKPSDTPVTRAERAARFQALISDEPSLPEEMTWFQRSALASATLVVLGQLALQQTGPGLAELPADEFCDRLSNALMGIGMLPPVDLDGDDDQPDTPGSNAPLRAWCASGHVQQVLLQCASQVQGARDDLWERWRHRRFAASVAATFLGAASRARPELDTEALSVDLGPTPGAEGLLEVWITEQAPGGNGQVEEILRTIGHDPRQFRRLLTAELAPSSLEYADTAVRGLLQEIQHNAELQRAVGAMQAAWSEGHGAVAEAFGQIRVATTESGLSLDRTAWTIFSNRLAGPGSTVELLEVAQRLLEQWEAVEAALGIQLDAREFAALVSHDPHPDAALRLGTSVAPPRRARAVSNLLWPRADSAGSADGLNQFGLLPPLDMPELRSALTPDTETVEIRAPDSPAVGEARQRLADRGEVVLAFPQDSTALARSVILGFQQQPIDAGALLVYPAVVGVELGTGGLIRVTLATSEVM